MAILDANKEGFLRSQTSLTQTIGRAARNLNGTAILYADRITDSLRFAIDETTRRRTVQQNYNEAHGIEPASIIKSIDSDLVKMANLDYLDIRLPSQKSKHDLAEGEDLDKAISRLSKEMKDAAKNLDFEKAAEIRDRLRELKEMRSEVEVYLTSKPNCMPETMSCLKSRSTVHSKSASCESTTLSILMRRPTSRSVACSFRQTQRHWKQRCRIPIG